MQTERVFLNDALFVLYSASVLTWPDLTRTNFQKILYFCSVLSPLAKINWDYDFSNAPFGPFSREIHRAVDILVVYGYAQVEELTIQKDAKLRVRYKISNNGVKEVSQIKRLKKEQERLDWIYTIMKVLDVYGQTVITKLAYMEPTFYSMRRRNKGGIINLGMEENQSIMLMEKVDSELQQKYLINLDTLASKLITYFSYLYTEIGMDN